MPVIISKEAKELAELWEEDYDDWAYRTVECGLHSGFPKCCIFFFCKIWTNINYKIMTDYRDAEESIGIHRAGYVMCPACVLSKNIIQVKKCTCGGKRTIKFSKK